MTNRWPLVLVVTLSAIWVPTLWWGFSSDDFFLVAIDWPRFAANPFLRNGRPVEMLPFALLPDRAFVHHAVSLAIYLACLVLMWRLCRRLSFDAWSTFLALSAFFHPAFLWSATWIAQRNDLLVIAFVLAAMVATRTGARLAWIAIASGAKTPYLFQNIVFAGAFARRRQWMATAIPLLCLAVFAAAGYLTHYARGVEGNTLANPSIPLTTSMPLRAAKVLEGSVYVFAPFPMFAATWWGPIAAFAVYAALWLVIASSLDRARLRSSTTGWLLALALSMCIPFVFASEVRVTAEAVALAWPAVASAVRWNRAAKAAVVALLAINLAAIGLNYRTFESRVYDVRARPVEKDLSQPAYRYQAWREGMRQRMLAALGLPVRPRPVQ